MDSIWLATGLAVAYIVVIVLTELLTRKLNVSSEITRRAMHIFSGLYTILIYYLLPAVEYLTLVIISLVVVVVSKKFNVLSSIHQVKRKTYGEVFLPVGTLTTYLISQAQAEIFVPSILIMTFADSFAGIVSDYYKTQKQSWQGSVVFFVTTTVILMLGGGADIGLALLVALGITLVERYTPYGVDNFTVPVASALVLLLL